MSASGVSAQQVCSEQIEYMDAQPLFVLAFIDEADVC